jgi:hypothetical protein
MGENIQTRTEETEWELIWFKTGLVVGWWEHIKKSSGYRKCVEILYRLDNKRCSRNTARYRWLWESYIRTEIVARRMWLSHFLLYTLQLHISIISHRTVDTKNLISWWQPWINLVHIARSCFYFLSHRGTQSFHSIRDICPLQTEKKDSSWHKLSWWNVLFTL